MAALPIMDLCWWRSKYGGMSVPDAKRLKEIERENACPKILLADSLLENESVREVLRKRGKVTGTLRSGANASAHELSEHHAWREQFLELAQWRCNKGSGMLF